MSKFEWFSLRKEKCNVFHIFKVYFKSMKTWLQGFPLTSVELSLCNRWQKPVKPRCKGGESCASVTPPWCFRDNNNNYNDYDMNIYKYIYTF